MLIIIDKKIPKQAKEHLKKYGKLFELETHGIVDDAISGHPDIFMCQMSGMLIISPQAPLGLIEMLSKYAISFIIGDAQINGSYPICASFNAVATEKYLVHYLNITDHCILDVASDLEPINVMQGFTRCSLLSVADGFITSDMGVYKKLKASSCDVLYVKTDEIVLPGHKYGFFGGCCGINDHRVFISGSLKNYKDGLAVEDFIKSKGFQVVELYDGPLFDGGSIFLISL